MKPQKTVTETLKNRIELILIEEINTIKREDIHLYVDKTANKLLSLLIDEIEHSRRR